MDAGADTEEDYELIVDISDGIEVDLSVRRAQAARHILILIRDWRFIYGTF